MQQHGSKYFYAQTPPPWGGVKSQNSNFPERSHVAYQIKWNHECSSMVTNISTADHHHLGVGEIE